MPLSPLRARMALAAFLVICGGVAGNLFSMQEPRGAAPAISAPNGRAAMAMDAARLDRLAMDASGGPAPTALRPTPRPDTRRVRSSQTRADESGGGETKAGAHRVGSFAPSSGQLGLAALPGADPAEARRATVRAVQAELGRRGYEPGIADGATGLVTRAAVLAYEYDQGLPLTADPSPEVLAHLRHGTSAPGAAIGLETGAVPPTGHAEAVIRSAQQSLGQLGYLAVGADGIATDETVRAIREFEMDSGLVPTGRISGPLIARLARALGRGKAETQ